MEVEISAQWLMHRLQDLQREAQTVSDSLTYHARKTVLGVAVFSSYEHAQLQSWNDDECHLIVQGVQPTVHRHFDVYTSIRKEVAQLEVTLSTIDRTTSLLLDAPSFNFEQSTSSGVARKDPRSLGKLDRTSKLF